MHVVAIHALVSIAWQVRRAHSHPEQPVEAAYCQSKELYYAWMLDKAWYYLKMPGHWCASAVTVLNLHMPRHHANPHEC